ncbi:MAG TPA: CPBP family intramembrane glutamic endopeptidase [Anaerolineae bacterium]|nr:CPBP family intramembrane glutamic endopeptidase [Anaerolineae bacterium]
MAPTSRREALRNIIIFTILVNGLAWLGPVLGGDPTTPGPGFLLWGIAPLASAMVVKLSLQDKVSLGLRPMFRGNGRWYALSILAFPVAIAVVLVLGLLLGASTINSFDASAFLTAMVPLAVTYLVFALFEEGGWRGYLAPRVYGLNDGLLGHVLVGVIWASWHFPYLRELWTHTSEGLFVLLPRFFLGTTVFAVVYGEIRIRTGSVWPAVLMHWIGNTFANTLLVGYAGDGFVALVPGKEWLGSFGVEGVFIIAFFGLLGCILYLQRRRRTEAQLPLAASQS